MLEKSVVEKCWRRELEEKRRREVLAKRVVEMCGRAVREKSVVEKCWRRVLYRSVGEECWQHWCKKMSGIKVLLFNECSCVQLLLDSAAC